MIEAVIDVSGEAIPLIILGILVWVAVKRSERRQQQDGVKSFQKTQETLRAIQREKRFDIK